MLNFEKRENSIHLQPYRNGSWTVVARSHRVAEVALPIAIGRLVHDPPVGGSGWKEK